MIQLPMSRAATTQRSRTLASLLTAATAVTAFTSHAHAQASITPLGKLPGGGGSAAYDVSDDGSIVVGKSGNNAFRWTQTGGMVGLGLLPEYGSCVAVAISDDGKVIVGNCASIWQPGTQHQAFRWTQNQGLLGLGDLAGGTVNSYANAVNHDGSVIVGEGYTGSSIDATMWTAAGVTSLGELPGGIDFGIAFAVSDDGLVVAGRSHGLNIGPEAFRWTAVDGMVGLGDLPGGQFNSMVVAMSDDGLTFLGVGTTPTTVEPFLWRVETGMVPLGLLPGVTGNTNPSDISGDGKVFVGYYWGNSNPDIALRWTKESGMVSLMDLLIEHGVDPAADGWTQLNHANGVNQDGTVIVGLGMRNGLYEAFRAVIPLDAPCYPDCDGDATLTIDDYVCFQTLYAVGNPQADCDASGSLDIDDFICFQTAFAIGC